MVDVRIGYISKVHYKLDGDPNIEETVMTRENVPSNVLVMWLNEQLASFDVCLPTATSIATAGRAKFNLL